MPDMESLDRAVEEARVRVFRQTHRAFETCPMCEREIETLIAAVSERARAEERERHREGLERLKSALLAQIGSHVRPPFERARSSEEAGG